MILPGGGHEIADWFVKATFANRQALVFSPDQSDPHFQDFSPANLYSLGQLVAYDRDNLCSRSIQRCR